MNIPDNSAKPELTLSEQLAYSTVRLECEKIDKSIITGTGFFYKLKNNRVVIITNKHVVQDAKKGRFFLTMSSSNNLPINGSHEEFVIPNEFQNFWIYHQNPNIDLCAMSINPIINGINKNNKKIFIRPIDQSFLPTESDIEEMIGLEDITMVGYPNGIWDDKNNLPIFRRGHLASHYNFNWQGREEFLIDAACFPGSSGSPIMLLDTSGYQTKKGYIMGNPRLKLLGILYGGPQYNAKGEIFVENTQTNSDPFSLTKIPNNLGFALKSNLINFFEETN